ncbi:MAG: hypothetical protein PHQ78_03940 [Candidatus Cloacimonetes bacterium]|jgi:hypothetical protein|nr:hypothetical protein [Candidatus Cloacimonadota bacterium]MDD2506451.1 hypothetical protein [Candidatus Cloacimonadota bacterium]MDD4560005.1 hypothetical protein [Candidatus Cloacimonadota bacterium]
MKISGFSFVRNGEKLYYPTVEAIRSILPICDEFVIAIGKGDEDDHTRELVAAIRDPKIRIIDTVWEEKYCHRGMINSYQTDIAMKECCGDWLFYVQADEVVHEKYLPAIKARCEELLHDTEVEGLLFKYRHFWGDYRHYHSGHGWYPWEIRIVRNLPNIHSYQSAQSFRWFEHYDNPRQETGTRKLKVASVDAYIYHYGWVRPPHLMQNKRRALDSVHWGKARAENYYASVPDYFDYGPLDRLAIFTETHPEVMKDMISRFDWADKLQSSGKPHPGRKPHKHERLGIRLLSLLEKITGPIGTFKNYIELKR